MEGKQRNVKLPEMKTKTKQNSQKAVKYTVLGRSSTFYWLFFFTLGKKNQSLRKLRIYYPIIMQYTTCIHIN